ncbi:MAG: hypothetical protein GYB67_06570 [Chloroflexi bacterium]|nr:hypothetical protein [Chloroflexota bacterium]
MDYQVANATELVLAIEEANSRPEESHCIALTGQDPDYEVRVSTGFLDGPTAFPIISCDIMIMGNGRTILRSNEAPPFRFFGVSAGAFGFGRARLTLHEVALVNGDGGADGGGAIRNEGSLELRACLLRDNISAFGGALYNDDFTVATLVRTVLVHNQARQLGGAIYNSRGGTLILRRCTSHRNQTPDLGGGIYTVDGVRDFDNAIHIESSNLLDGLTFQHLGQVDLHLDFANGSPTPRPEVDDTIEYPAAVLSAPTLPRPSLQPSETVLSQIASQIHGSNDHASTPLLVALHNQIAAGFDATAEPLVQTFIAREGRKRGRFNNFLWLPLRLLEIERGLLTQSASSGRRTFGDPGAFMRSETPRPVADLPEGRGLPRFTETTSFGLRSRMGAALQYWFVESELPQYEARAYLFTPAVTPAAVTERLLLALKLDSLVGAESITLRAATPDQVVATIFAAAHDGGPYGGALAPAVARLLTWRSIAGLVGADEASAVSAIALRAESCQWWLFAAKSRWFHNAGWDLGVIVLRPDGQTLAVLAASASA